MSETKIGYKVCRNTDDGKLVSVVAYGWLWHSCYDIDQWTTPIKACGPLTVFDTLQNAIDFQIDLKEYRPILAPFQKLGPGYSSIFECEWVPWDKPLVHMPFAPKESAHNSIKALWQRMFSMSIDKLPIGTQLAKAVKLRKCVG